MFYRRILPVLALGLIPLFFNAQNIDPNYVDGALYVKFHNYLPVGYAEDGNIDLGRYPALQPIFEKYEVVKSYKSFGRAKSNTLQHTIRVEFSQADKADDFVEELKKHSVWIDYAEKVPCMYTTFTPDDLGPTGGSGNQWGLYQILAEDAWDITLGDQDVVVAICDDAVDIDHEDLNPVLWTNPGEIPGNGIDDDGNGYVDDIHGYDVADDDNDPRPGPGMTHGTHVAGISGAATDNSTGVASIGAGVAIMSIKSTYSSSAVTHAYEGLTYAGDNSPHVVNCSWGGGSYSTTGQNVVNYTYGQGTIVVAAAGNDNVSTPFYPAAYNNVISVASTASGDQKSSFSNYGSTIDVSAPGSSIFSTVPSDGYSVKSGTSMASPMVTGLIGLMFSLDPSMPRSDVETCLDTTCDNIDAANPSYIGDLGSGRINAKRAVECAEQFAVILPINAGILSIVSPSSSYSGCNPQTVDVTINVRNYGTQTQTSIPVGYTLDSAGSVLSTVNETVNQTLTQGASVTYTFSSPVTLPGPGTFTLTTWTSLSGDGNLGNDTDKVIIEVIGEQEIYVEDFESGSLSSMGWTVNNPDGSNTWDLDNVGGASSGVRAAYIDMYYYTDGAIDQLISPSLDLSTASDLKLNFEHAHRRRSSSFQDSLYVRVSTDGGSTFPNTVLAVAEDGTGSFATGTIISGQFNPTTDDDWCHTLGTAGASCFEVDLSAYDGEADVKIMFETVSGSCNNLYLDNVRVTGNCGSSSSPLMPSADFYANQTTICTGQQVSFTNSSTNATSYSWSFPGGSPTSSTVMNPSVVYNSAGTYQVQLVSTNTAGSDTETKTNYITVHEKAAAAFTPNPVVGTLQIDFNNTSTGSINWAWDFGDGATSTMQNPSHTYSAPGTYNVCLIAGNLNCDPDTQCTMINVDSFTTMTPPVANFSVSSTSICEGGSVNFFDNSTNSPTQWNWTFQNGIPGTSTVENPTVLYNTPGTYSVTLTATNSGGSDSYTATGYISVFESNQADYSYLTSGLQVNFTDLSQGASTWSWDFGGAGTSTSQNPTFTFPSDGSYNVCLTVDNPGCEDDTYCQMISVMSSGMTAPQANFSLSSSAVCTGDTIYFYDQSTNSPTSWDWSFTGASPTTSNLQNPYAVYAAAGSYDVSLTAANGGGTDTYMGSSIVNVYDQPTAGFSYNWSNLDVQFMDASVNAASWTWGFGDGNFSTAPAPNHTYAADGSYEVCLTVWNPGCGEHVTCDTVTVKMGGGNVGLSDQKSEHILQVYPNPVRDILNVELKGGNNYQIVLTDALGKVLYNNQHNNNSKNFTTQISMSDKRAGVYLLMVNEEVYLSLIHI